MKASRDDEVWQATRVTGVLAILVLGILIPTIFGMSAGLGGLSCLLTGLAVPAWLITMVFMKQGAERRASRGGKDGGTRGVLHAFFDAANIFSLAMALLAAVLLAIVVAIVSICSLAH